MKTFYKITRRKTTKPYIELATTRYLDSSCIVWGSYNTGRVGVSKFSTIRIVTPGSELTVAASASSETLQTNERVKECTFNLINNLVVCRISFGLSHRKVHVKHDKYYFDKTVEVVVNS